MKNEDYLVHNLQLIGKHLEHINWNLGKIMAHLTNNSKLIKEIEEEEENPNKIINLDKEN